MYRELVGGKEDEEDEQEERGKEAEAANRRPREALPGPKASCARRLTENARKDRSERGDGR